MNDDLPPINMDYDMLPTVRRLMRMVWEGGYAAGRDDEARYAGMDERTPNPYELPDEPNDLVEDPEFEDRPQKARLWREGFTLGHLHGLAVSESIQNGQPRPKQPTNPYGEI